MIMDNGRMIMFPIAPGAVPVVTICLSEPRMILIPYSRNSSRYMKGMNVW